MKYVIILLTVMAANMNAVESSVGGICLEYGYNNDLKCNGVFVSNNGPSDVVAFDYVALSIQFVDKNGKSVIPTGYLRSTIDWTAPIPTITKIHNGDKLFIGVAYYDYMGLACDLPSIQTVAKDREYSIIGYNIIDLANQRSDLTGLFIKK